LNAVYVYDDHLRLVINNVEGNQRFPLEDLPEDSPGSDNVTDGVPIVLHPNTRISVFRIAI
jgi:hypothetical protein